ncbi:heavy-metal-associated domain-containing protein [Novipirellula rosea]|uniref:Heavy-metal-associated domain-containing protein n=1 Tax=Novipirellula rosea TaxID=1031540 RepID=A0ABP8N2F9_9BACT|tara:strand:+ start:1887 stop:2273 length:387 start_codon:yes stop_codon:yes gene_type:complete
MRGIAYAIAALAAVIIMVAVAKMPPQSEQAANEVASAATETVSTAVMADEGTLTLAVPEMHCSVSCYPRVKELLENTEAVDTVELAAQKEEGIIDNRQVIVHYKPGFDVGQALTALEKEGFAKSDVVH